MSIADASVAATRGRDLLSELAARVADLRVLEYTMVGGEDLQELARLTETVGRLLFAVQVTQTDEIDQRGLAAASCPSTAALLKDLLRIPAHEARSRVRTARVTHAQDLPSGEEAPATLPSCGRRSTTVTSIARTWASSWTACGTCLTGCPRRSGSKPSNSSSPTPSISIPISSARSPLTWSRCSIPTAVSTRTRLPRAPSSPSGCATPAPDSPPSVAGSTTSRSRRCGRPSTGSPLRDPPRTVSGIRGRPPPVAPTPSWR